MSRNASGFVFSGGEVLKADPKATQAKRIATMRAAFDDETKAQIQRANAFERVLLIMFDVLAFVYSDKKSEKTFNAARAAFDVICQGARDAIRDGLKGADLATWRSFGTIPKDKTEADRKEPTRENLKANIGKMTGRVLATFRALEYSYTITSKARTVLKQVVEARETMSASAQEFLKVQRIGGNDVRGISAEDLYQRALACQLSGGKSTEYVKAATKRNAAATSSATAKTTKSMDVKSILTAARENLLKIGKLELAQAIVDLALHIGNVKIRAVSAVDVATAQGTSKLKKS